MRIIENYNACYPDPLNLKVGDQIQLLEKNVPIEWKGWHWCRDSVGNEGWISESYFKRVNEQNGKAKIIKNYIAREISVIKDEQIDLLYEDCGWAWCKRNNGEDGWVPTKVLDGTMDLPEFTTNRLFMRGVRLEDVENYERNFANYEVIQHLSYQVPWPYPKGAVKNFLEEIIFPEQGIKRWLWAIFLKNNRNEVIGCVDLFRKGHPENRGFWLARQHWDNGYMTEAVHPIMDYAFNKLGFEKLIFSNAVENKRSRRIKEKTGATYIENRPSKFVNPEYKEQEIWELTKENWFKFKEVNKNE